jgi:hypothetical protein
MSASSEQHFVAGFSIPLLAPRAPRRPAAPQQHQIEASPGRPPLAVLGHASQPTSHDEKLKKFSRLFKKIHACIRALPSRGKKTDKRLTTRATLGENPVLVSMHAEG